MIKINIEEHKLQKLESDYKDALIKWLNDKGYIHIDDKGHINTAIEKENKDTTDKSLEWSYYVEHIESLITCNPEDMIKQWDLFLKDEIAQDYQDWNNSSSKEKEKNNYGKFRKKMTYLYNRFIKDKCLGTHGVGYWFFDSLGLDVCPYCNRNYILTIKANKHKKSQYRPEIDHFYPKSVYPIFALSFYNFVPACPTCNHIKRERQLKISPWIGYAGKKEPIFRVKNANINPFPENPKIKIVHGNRKDMSILGNNRVYKKHTDVVKDILNRIQAYNTDAYSAVLESFQGIVNTEGELDRMVWGNYTDPDEFSKRPLSKLTSDILKQYKIK